MCLSRHSGTGDEICFMNEGYDEAILQEGKTNKQNKAC